MSGEIEVIDATIGEIKRLEQLAFKHMAEDANRRQRIEELEKMLAERNHNIDLTCVAPVYGLNACGYRTLHDGGRWGCKYESLCEYQTPKRPVVCWNPNDTKFKINPLPAEQDYDAEKREEIEGDRKEAIEYEKKEKQEPSDDLPDDAEYWVCPHAVECDIDSCCPRQSVHVHDPGYESEIRCVWPDGEYKTQKFNCVRCDRQGNIILQKGEKK